MHFEEQGASHQACGGGARCYGGAPRFYEYRLRQSGNSRRDDVFLVDAGGLIDGRILKHPLGEDFVSQVVKSLKFQVMALGAPELSGGIDNLAKYTSLLGYFVCTNIQFSEASMNAKIVGSLCRKSIIKVFSKVSLAFLSYVQPDTVQQKDPSITILDAVTSLNSEIKRLQQQKKPLTVVVLAYSNDPLGRDVLDQVPGISVLVSGHSHAMFYNGVPPNGAVGDFSYPEVVETRHGEVLVVGSYFHLAFVGNLQLTFDLDGNFIRHEPSNLAFLGPDVTANKVMDIKMTMSLRDERKPLLEFMGGEVGRSPYMLDGSTRCSRQECSMGNLVTDVMVDLVAQSAGFQRPDALSWAASGTALLEGQAVVGSTIIPGDIMAVDIDNIIRNDTSLELVLITGDELLNLLKDMVKSVASGDASDSFLQTSGLRITGEDRVEKVEILCTKCLVPSFIPLEENEVYHVVMTTSLADRQTSSGFLTTEMENRRELLHNSLRNATIEYIRRMSPVRVVLRNRMKLTKLAGGTSCPTVFGGFFSVVLFQIKHAL